MVKNKRKSKDLKKRLLELLESSSESETEILVPKKRRRIILSDDSEEENVPPPNQKTIAPSLLEKIGHKQQTENTFCLHGDIKSIWKDVLQRGLNKDTRESIIRNIPSIRDCSTSAPVLNPEIKGTLSAQAVKRDDHICEKQSIIGAAICGLSKILQSMIDGEACDDTTIENMSNNIRLLCEVHYLESQTRRAVILPGLNKDLKDSLEKTDIDQNLFGKNLSDIIRDARSLEKSKKELTKEKTLNNWGPSGVRKQGGQQNYKRPYQPPPAKHSSYHHQRQHRQQFRAMIKPKDKEVLRRAPIDNRRRRI